MDDVLEHSRFKNDTIRNVVNTVKEWVRVCEQYNCDEVIATGTAALRQSSNTDSLTSSIKNELGINVEIISKSKEAGYVYSGVHSMFSEGIPLAVLNLGGGSTQISIGSENKPSHKILLDIGTKYITDKWAWEEPFDHSRYVNMLEHVTDKFQSEIPDGIGETGKLVHTGGELDFLLKCQVPMSVCNVSSSHVSKISRGRFEKFSRRFSELTPSKVANKFSLDPKWSAGSVASNVIAIAAMRTIGADELVPSNLNVADGVAISQFESD
jgi:exopolyphosphatase/guanosine-5'-triphosphate,3'-diphosphate pyrophosphatase